MYFAPGIWAQIFGNGTNASLPNTYEWAYEPFTSSLAHHPLRLVPVRHINLRQLLRRPDQRLAICTDVAMGPARRKLQRLRLRLRRLRPDRRQPNPIITSTRPRSGLRLVALRTASVRTPKGCPAAHRGWGGRLGHACTGLSILATLGGKSSARPTASTSGSRPIGRADLGKLSLTTYRRRPYVRRPPGTDRSSHQVNCQVIYRVGPDLHQDPMTATGP